MFFKKKKKGDRQELQANTSINDEPGYKYPYLSGLALEKFIHDYEFNSVLDLGCGVGYHSKELKEAGKVVTSFDYGKSVGYLLNKEKDNVILDDFMAHDFGDIKYDAIWCSHVLEHQTNTNLFLRKINGLLNDNGGILAITVPPLKHDIVGGHINLYNAGILLCQLVLAGFNCSTASVKTYGYNISVITRKEAEIDLSNKLVMGAGDIQTMKPYLPDGIKYSEGNQDISFNGEILELNW